MPCLTEEAALDLAHGALATGARGPALEHLDACPDCRALVAALAKRTPPRADLEGDPTALRGLDARKPAQMLVAGTRLGRYVVERYLGCGGMGVVYAARDPELERRVAVKLLRAVPVDQEDPTASRGRLLREAQAMARLSHPNVVAIYDVGEAMDQVFIAMELVEGQTLAAWCQARKRTWREVVQVFADAGRGLAAAHRAGLTHRDFKQSNVMIGVDGRVRVMDFSLARAATDAPLPATPTFDPSVLSASFTQSGALIGTPAYMAPEQFEGQVADARTDQFNFCVALYEALYGERPFPGTTVDELAQRVRAGDVSPAPLGARVPGRLRKRVLKGLSLSPGRRFETMDGLVAALLDARAGPVRRMFPLAAAALGLGAVGAWAFAARQSGLCSGAAQRIAHAWGPAQSAAARSAFRRTGLASAEASFGSTASALDAYAAAWAAMSTESCEATSVHGSQSDGAFAARAACLDDARMELDAFAQGLSGADAQEVRGAPAAAAQLSTLGRCADLKTLLAPVRPSADPALQAGLFEVRRTLARARALELLGKPAQGEALAGGAVPLARQLGDRPLEAEALSLWGWLEDQAGHPAQAAEHLEQAALAAEASRHDLEAARALVRLVRVEGVSLGRAEEAAAAARRARAALERLGGDRALQAELDEYLQTEVLR